ncbi:MAG TPA: folate-binding protein [Gammaproteobacteria bacterium]|nr:folate-binding protein [Gammaproteobacteria bacterium]
MADSPAQAVFCDLSDRALIRVAGADARTFLQGQLSNDVRQVSPELSQLTALNTPQGRTLALMRLFEFDGTLFLLLPEALRVSIVKRLQMYVLRAQVEITQCNDLAVAGIAGDAATAVLATAGIEAPESVDQCIGGDGMAAIRVPGDALPRYEVVAPPTQLAVLREHCQTADIDEWRLMDTLVGIPLLGPETSGEFVAQMLNLDLLGAICFQKGCYTGQEVIARAHYRGRVKRRLRLILRSQPAEPGTTVALSENESVTVIQSAQTPRQEYATLVVGPVNGSAD